MNETRTRERGSARWVATRVSALGGDDERARAVAARELVEWIYAVAYRRAKARGLSPDERADVVQDAMTRVAQALQSSLRRLAVADNPAALLERITARAVAEGCRNVRMAGFGGAPPNGRNWGVPHPHRVSDEAARQLFDELPTPVIDAGGEVEQAAAEASRWIGDHIGVTLTADSYDALVYILDRLVAGVGRPTLVRGGSSCLRHDPAMRHLGFSEETSSAFALWLLGRHDAHHHTPSVLDGVLGDECDDVSIERWRDVAVSVGFATRGRDRFAS